MDKIYYIVQKAENPHLEQYRTDNVMFYISVPLYHRNDFMSNSNTVNLSL